MIRIVERRRASKADVVVVVGFILIVGTFLTLVVGGLVTAWRQFDGNVAGWITTFVVGLVGYGLASMLGLEQAFARASRRRQYIIVTGLLLIAGGGSGAYIAWPGTTSWWVCGLATFPIAILLAWLAKDSEDGGGEGGGGFEGPWTAP